MDAKHEGHGTVPGGGIGFVIDGTLKPDRRIIKRNRNPEPVSHERLEDIVEPITNPDAKALYDEGFKLAIERPIWAPGGLLETAEKLKDFERRALINGAASGRARDIIHGERQRVMAPGTLLKGRENADREYFEGILKDREAYPDHIPHRDNQPQMTISAHLDVIKSSLGNLDPFIWEAAKNAAKRNLGYNPSIPPSEELLRSRTEAEADYLREAIALRKRVDSEVLPYNA